MHGDVNKRLNLRRNTSYRNYIIKPVFLKCVFFKPRQRKPTEYIKCLFLNIFSYIIMWELNEGNISSSSSFFPHQKTVFLFKLIIELSHLISQPSF